MTMQTPSSSFLLVDCAQLTVADLPVPLPTDAPAWMMHLYDAKAAAVSPVLIDIDAADKAGDCDQMAALKNAMQAQLHASFIDTTLSHEALAQHLRRFIVIRTVVGKAFTLRFADCTVLRILAAVFSAAQWTALASPITRWCVHGLDGELATLPPADTSLCPAQTPLVLTDEQLAVLREASAPSVMLSHLLDINHGDALPGSPVEQHRWASTARHVWRSAGNADEIVLRWLTSAALATHGHVLRQARLPTLLASGDVGAIRNGLLDAVRDHQTRGQAS